MFGEPALYTVANPNAAQPIGPMTTDITLLIPVKTAKDKDIPKILEQCSRLNIFQIQKVVR